MRPSEVAVVLRDLIPSGVPIYLQGPPGVGKSSLVWQAASAIYDGETVASTVGGLPDVPWYYALRATDRDPVDLRGLPMVVDGNTVWSRPDLLAVMEASKVGGVICIEELPQATNAVQCVLREVLLDRRIGGNPIPPNWFVCATGNRAEDRAGAQRLLSHVASACVILDLEVSHDDSQTWMLHAGIIPEVRSFLQWSPSMLHSFDPARQRNADPRGWERVSRIVPRVSREDVMLPVVTGCVGEGPAAKFCGFRQIYKQLPAVEDILADPKNATVPTEPQVQYALCGALSEAARKATPKILGGLVTYADRLPKEFSVLLMRDAVSVNPAILAVPEAKAWLKSNRNLLLEKE